MTNFVSNLKQRTKEWLIKQRLSWLKMPPSSSETSPAKKDNTIEREIEFQ